MPKPKAVVWRSIAEYTNILSVAREGGWIGPLLVAHLTPCTREQSTEILAAMHLPNLRVQWRAGSGGRTSDKKGWHRITLPRDPLVPGERNYGTLRVGIVLHEAAHVISERESGGYGHGWSFQQTFRRLITTFPWRRFVPATCSDYPALYARHRGPYSLMTTTETTKMVKGEAKITHGTGHVRGPFKNAEAHDDARRLVATPDVVNVFVFSDSEQQFIGAFYERGQDIPTWKDAKLTSAATRAASTSVRVEHPAEGEEPARLPDGDQPVRGVAEADAVPAEPKRSRPAAMPRVPPTPRKAVALVAPAAAGEWPKSRGPQIIREWFEAEPGRQATVAEITSALGPALTEAGIQFPASLISRLKQGGFLVHASTESNDGQEGTAD